MSDTNTTVATSQENPAANAEALAKANAEFLAKQSTLLAEIGKDFQRFEKDSAKALQALANNAAEYVDNAIAHSAESKRGRAFTDSVKAIEEYLEAEFGDDAPSIGLSRLLGMNGLASLVDDEKIIGAISQSKLKVLILLIQRDTSASGLSYVWKDAVKESGPKFVSQLAKMPMTVVELQAEVNRLLNGKDTTTESAGDAEAQESAEGSKGGTKSAAQRASKSIAKALKDAESSGERKATVTRLVKTEAITAGDIRNAIAALAAEKRVAELKSIYQAARKALEKLMAENDAAKESAAEA